MKRPLITYLTLGGLLLLVLTVAGGVGAFSIQPGQVLQILLHQLALVGDGGFSGQQEAIVVHIRLPRIVLGAVVGAGLALSGATLQGLFRNPLAAPGLIGITAGSTAAAASFIVGISALGLALGSWWMQYGLAVSAFLGACGTGLMVLRIATFRGQTQVTTLLLAGVAVQALVIAFTGFLIFLADDDQLRDLTFWTMGSLGGATWSHILTVVPFVLFPLVILPTLGRVLNAFSLGESSALLLGIPVQRLKITLFILSTLAVGAAVAVAGTIGFVGLVVPHLTRKLFGADYRHLIPLSALNGAILLVVADTLARTLVAPMELPIGVVTAIVGAPVFLQLLLKNRSKGVARA